MFRKFIWASAVCIVCSGCGGGSSNPISPSGGGGASSVAGTTSVAAVTSLELTQAPDFTPKEIPLGDPLYGLFNKYIKVFGIGLLAVNGYPDQMLTHVATITAEYLDNNEDGAPDNLAVNSALQRTGASFLLLTTEGTQGSDGPPEWVAIRDRSEVNYISEFTVMYRQANKGGTVCGEDCGELNDTALEHVPELIQKAGYGQVYPSDFAPTAGTTLALAMDDARGGHFKENPTTYPASAWYTAWYPYEGHFIEYFYWGLVTHLGMFGDRSPRVCAAYYDEWKLCTAAEFRATDKKLYAMLTDSRFNLPKVAPNGVYR